MECTKSARAQLRARTFNARQSILLIMEMVLHTLIAIVGLKAAEINRSEVTKKVDTFALLMSRIHGK